MHHARRTTRALALVTTVSLASLGTAAGLAQAAVPRAGTSAHHAHAVHAVPRRAAAPTVTLGVTKSGITPSARITPGNTVFDVRRAGSGGSVLIVSFKHGYTIKDLLKDGQKLFSGDVKTVRRVDKDVVAYGGVPTPKAKGDAASFGLSLKAGHYYFVNVDKGTASGFTVRGRMQHRALPATRSTQDYVGEMSFADHGHLVNGWVKQTNHADEPHFTDIEGVKPGTTHAQVKKYFDGGAQGRPSFATGESHGNLPLSPGHSFQFLLKASDGPVVLACWWPSDENGAPHALMGMWRLTRVTG